MARGSDDLVMLELCTIHQVISYPDFSQISQVLNVSYLQHAFVLLFNISDLVLFAVEYG